MVDKAQIERLTELVRAAQGKETKRPLADILQSERAAAEKYVTRVPVTRTGLTPPES